MAVAFRKFFLGATAPFCLITVRQGAELTSAAGYPSPSHAGANRLDFLSVRGNQPEFSCRRGYNAGLSVVQLKGRKASVGTLN